MASTQQAAPSVVRNTDRRAQAVALRMRGYTYSRIGQFLGVAKQTAHGLVVEALEARRRELAESVDEVRSLENERLDKMTLILFKRLEDPRNEDTERTVSAILRVSERRAAMNGLDAPKDYRITPGGANIIPSGGDIDVEKLTVDQLRELEEIQTRYDALRAVAAPVQLPAGDPVEVVPAPTQGGDHGTTVHPRAG